MAEVTDPSPEYPWPAQHPEFRKFENLVCARRKARDTASLLEHMCDAQAEVLKQIRATCSHDRYFLGVGRHGSEKGESFFKCRICGHHWSE